MTVGIDRIKPFEADAIPSPNLKLTANSVLPYDMFAEHNNNNNPERAPANRNDHQTQPTKSGQLQQPAVNYDYAPVTRTDEPTTSLSCPIPSTLPITTTESETMTVPANESGVLNETDLAVPSDNNKKDVSTTPRKTVV